MKRVLRSIVTGMLVLNVVSRAGDISNEDLAKFGIASGLYLGGTAAGLIADVKLSNAVMDRKLVKINRQLVEDGLTPLIEAISNKSNLLPIPKYDFTKLGLDGNTLQNVEKAGGYYRDGVIFCTQKSVDNLKSIIGVGIQQGDSSDWLTFRYGLKEEFVEETEYIDGQKETFSVNADRRINKFVDEILKKGNTSLSKLNRMDLEAIRAQKIRLLRYMNNFVKKNGYRLGLGGSYKEYLPDAIAMCMRAGVYDSSKIVDGGQTDHHLYLRPELLAMNIVYATLYLLEKIKTKEALQTYQEIAQDQNASYMSRLSNWFKGWMTLKRAGR